METVHYNLAEEEFSKEGKIILWIFAAMFFLTGIFVLYRSLVLGHKDIQANLSIAPFGISLIVSIFAAYATIKRKNLYFSVTDEKIEFRFGIINPKLHLFQWVDIKELIVPLKQKKIMLKFSDGKCFVINLNWIGKKKSVQIIKNIYLFAKSKNISILKVKYLTVNGSVAH
jgi:hypothetical protein